MENNFAELTKYNPLGIAVLGFLTLFIYLFYASIDRDSIKKASRAICILVDALALILICACALYLIFYIGIQILSLFRF